MERVLLPLKLGIDYNQVLYYNKQLKRIQVYSAVKKEFYTLKPRQSYYLYCQKNGLKLKVSSSASSGATTFTYDADGGRTKKTVSSADPGNSAFRLQTTTYIGSLFEKDSDGKTTKHIFAGSNRIATLILRASSAEGAASREETNYYHSDHLGSSNVITDASGAQVGFTEFTPYGSTFRQTGTYDPKHKFTGKELDSSTGLYFYGARYYDPQLGRFTQADTIVQAPYDPQSLNRYTYCRNNPLKYVDPSGHIFWLIPVIAKVIAGAIVGAVIGGVVSAATGGNIAQGFITGAIGGACFNVVGGLGLTGAAQTIGHAIAGAASGAASGAITGGDIGMNALIGGLSAGGSEFLSSNVSFLGTVAVDKLGAHINNILRRAFIGSVIGGAASAATGGDFGYGARQGAITSSTAYLTNHMMHKVNEMAKDAMRTEETPKPTKDVNKNSKDSQKKGAQEGESEAEEKAINRETVAWGITEIISGATAIGRAAAISTATGGAGTIVSGWLGFTGVISVATGVADVMFGIYGQPTTAEFVRNALSNDSIGTRLQQFTPEYMP